MCLAFLYFRSNISVNTKPKKIYKNIKKDLKKQKKCSINIYIGNNIEKERDFLC
jgi:hypothetical protein